MHIPDTITPPPAVRRDSFEVMQDRVRKLQQSVQRERERTERWMYGALALGAMALMLAALLGWLCWQLAVMPV